MTLAELEAEVTAARDRMVDGFARDNRVQVMVIAYDTITNRIWYAGHGFGAEDAPQFLSSALASFTNAKVGATGKGPRS